MEEKVKTLLEKMNIQEDASEEEINQALYNAVQQDYEEHRELMDELAK